MASKKRITDDLQALLLWARKERIVLSSVQIGAITVTVERDYGMTMPSQAIVPAQHRPSILEQYAGKLLQTDQPTDKNEVTVEDDE